MRLILFIIVLGYLPGAMIFRLPGRSRTFRAGLSSEERAFWAVVLSIAWSLGVVLLLGSISAYSFNRLLIINGAVSVLLAVALRRQILFGRDASPITLTALIPAAIVAAGIWLYFPTAEYVMGGKDPGVYINEGIALAQHGAIVIRDETVRAVPSQTRDLFFPSHNNPWYYSLRFMGFFIQDPNAGTVIGQFPHLFPASVAIGYGLNGLTGARQAIGVWGILGLLAVYFATARFLGRVAATCAAALLSINIIQLWFARYPNSELVMQALIFAAMLAFAYALDGTRRFFGAIAGTLLGLLVFARFEVLLAMMAFVVAASLAPAIRKHSGLSFAVTMTVGALLGLWYLLGPLRAYGFLPLGFMSIHGGWWLLLGLLIASSAIRRLLRIHVIADFTRRAVPIVLALIVLALAVYAYFFRQAGGRTAAADAAAFRTYAWFVAPWILGIASIGAVALILRRFWQDPAFFLTFALSAVFFFYKTRIVPEHFWAERRFLAVVLPGTMICIAGLFAEIANLKAFQQRRRPAVVANIVVAVLTIPIAVTFWRASAPILRYVEYSGLIPQLERLTTHVGTNDLLIVESRATGSELHLLALPLAYIYGRSALVFNTPVPEKRQLETFIIWAREKYRQVLFLGGGGTDLLTKRLTAEPVSNGTIRVQEYDAPHDAYPSGPKRKDFEFGLYRLVPAPEFVPGPIDLTIGSLDDLNVVRFYAREQHANGIRFRWTKNVSYIMLLGIPADARHLTLWMSNGGRPPQAPPAKVDVAIEEVPLGSATPDDPVRPYAFEIPASVAARAAAQGDPVRLRLSVSTWSPAATIGADDTRDLGVMVTRVTVR